MRFDEIRGYGFIAPDSGGEDVFLHANALLAEKHQYHPGVPVEFDVIEGERGLKATAVRVIKGRTAAVTPANGATVPSATPVTTPSSIAAGLTAAKPTPSPGLQASATHGPAAQPQAPQPGAAHSPAAQPHSSAANGSSVATATPPVPTPATVAAAASHGAPAIAPQRSVNGTERAVRESITADALSHELVEVCLESVPSMTGEQITQLRRAVLTLARRHGWVSE
nr:cold shock domain-containing protein [Kineosporia babensis]